MTIYYYSVVKPSESLKRAKFSHFVLYLSECEIKINFSRIKNIRTQRCQLLIFLWISSSFFIVNKCSFRGTIQDRSDPLRIRGIVVPFGGSDFIQFLKFVYWHKCTLSALIMVSIYTLHHANSSNKPNFSTSEPFLIRTLQPQEFIFF